jgi:hypothetical protein
MGLKAHSIEFGSYRDKPQVNSIGAGYKTQKTYSTSFSDFINNQMVFK